MVVEKAYAKLNIFLKVGARDSSGFHPLESLMVPLDLYDTLTFCENDTDEMELVDNHIPNNSVLKAALLFQEKYHTKGARITLEKRIPLAAGLGGGSADSSATLRGLNRLFGLGLPLEELEELAKQLGSDNVFCLYNRPALCEGRGEKLTLVEVPKLEVALMKPNYGFSTKDIFAAYDKLEITNHACDKLLTKIQTEKVASYRALLFNDLLKAVVPLYPEYQAFISQAQEVGIPLSMSGSGSCLFAIIAETKEIETLKHIFKENFLGVFPLMNTLS